MQQLLEHLDHHAHRQELRHEILDELGRRLAQPIEQLLHFLVAQQFVGVRLQQVAQMGGDHAARVDDGVALRLRLLAPRLVDPDRFEPNAGSLVGVPGIVPETWPGLIASSRSGKTSDSPTGAPKIVIR